MSQRIVQAVDLSNIISSMHEINNNVIEVNKSVEEVNDNVTLTRQELNELTELINNFVLYQIRQNRLGQAKTELIKIRQEIEKKFGHYGIVRRTTLGVIQANDIGIVRKNTIEVATEELMIQTPGYWLAPCLVALSAWISDKRELAEKAVKEAIRRDSEKTALFFLLICRRANRKSSAFKWLQSYLESQSAHEINKKTMIVLDAFSNGLLGVDSENVVSTQLKKWIQELSSRDNFIAIQRQQWSEAIKLHEEPVGDDEYEYLSRFSNSWAEMSMALSGARLHEIMFTYFIDILEERIEPATLIKELDDVLVNLVSNFDEEELSLRREEMLEELVVKYEGDEKQAQSAMNIEVKALEETKDFTQILTDAAMMPEISHASASTQKIAIALSKDWIIEAYKDLTAAYRMKVPIEITVNVDSYNGVTQDGSNEGQVLSDFVNLMNEEEYDILSNLKLSSFQEFCWTGGWVTTAIGVTMCIVSSILLGVVIGIAGIAMILHNRSCKENIEKIRVATVEGYKEKRAKGTEVIRNLMAEVVDFRDEFSARDIECNKVVELLSSITAEQYVRTIGESTSRKVQL
ncbi:MAG: hypothetical protein ACLSDF_01205 [Megasphaera micronuciformis]